MDSIVVQQSVSPRGLEDTPNQVVSQDLAVQPLHLTGSLQRQIREHRLRPQMYQIPASLLPTTNPPISSSTIIDGSRLNNSSSNSIETGAGSGEMIGEISMWNIVSSSTVTAISEIDPCLALMQGEEAITITGVVDSVVVHREVSEVHPGVHLAEVAARVDRSQSNLRENLTLKVQMLSLIRRKSRGN